MFFDEAVIIERFAGSYGVALAARPLEIVAISSAKPGEFRKLTKLAVPIAWPYTPPRIAPPNTSKIDWKAKLMA